MDEQDPLGLPDFADAPLEIPQAPGMPPQPQKGGGMGQLASMLPLIAAAASKGGRAGIAGFLQGFQRAQQQRMQQTRLGQQDARQGRIDQGNEDYRQQQVMLQAEARRQAGEQQAAQRRQQFVAALKDIDDPAAIPELARFFAADGSVPQADLEQIATTILPPSKAAQRAAEKRITKLRTEYGVKWMDEGAKFMHDLPGGQRVNFQQLLQMSGMTPDPNAPQAQAPPQIAPDVPLDRQHAAALASGDTKTAALILQAIKEQDAAKSVPADPQLANLNRQIAEMRLDTLRSAKDSNALPPAIARRVDSKTRGFDTLPIVKTTQKMAEAVTFANNLDVNTKNPADDQALIYAFAKAMDPDSVVREGEYATVQHYAQSWAESFGFNVARIASNTSFLTPQARGNMKRTIQAKFAAGRQQYDNVRRSYATQINRITGQSDGDDYLTDYAGGFDQEPAESPTGRATVTPPQTPPARAPVVNPWRR